MATAGWRATTGVYPSLMAGELERCLLIVLLYLILIIILILIKPVYNEHNRVAYPIQYTVNVGTVLYPEILIKSSINARDTFEDTRNIRSAKLVLYAKYTSGILRVYARVYSCVYSKYTQNIQ